MRVSTRGEYGLRAVLVLAGKEKQGSMPLREIAARENISEQYLEHLFRELRISGLVVSRRGSRGGYTLSREPSEITVGQVLRTLEGSLTPMECVDGGGTCIHGDDCKTQLLWKKLKNAMDEVLDSTTLADLLSMANVSDKE